MRRVIGVSSRRSVAREVDDELAFHLEMRTRQLMAGGMSATDARAEALRAFGDLERVRVACITHDQERMTTMSRASLLGELRQDVAYAFRTLRRNAGFAIVVVLTIALGVGANAAIFALVNAVLLRPLPVPEPRALVSVGDPGWVGAVSHSTQPVGEMFSWDGYRYLAEHSTAFTGVAAAGRADYIELRTESSQAEPDRPRARFVSANYFQVLRVPALYGRTFDGTADAEVGGAPIVVISHAYWTRKFAADPSVVGRDLLINSARFTIAGVAAAGFTGEVVGQSADLWMPIGMQAVVNPNRAYIAEREAYWLLLLGRLAPGVTLAQATSQVQQVMRSYFTTAGIGSAKDVAELAVPVGSGARGHSRVRAAFGGALVTMLLGSGLLLLVICANVANLLLARALARTREMSVRLAIGAGRGRLVRQLLTESLVLGMLGAGGGLLLARWGSRALVALANDRPTPIPLDPSLDGLVLTFTIGVAVLSATLFGLAPALRAARVNLASSLRGSARSMSGSLGQRGGRLAGGHALIAVQVALSLVLLTGASLLVRSLNNLMDGSTGLDRDHLAILDVDIRSRGYTGDRLETFAREVTTRLAQVPGVTAVTWSENGLFSGTESGTSFQVPGFTARAEDDTSSAYDLVGPGYVSAIGARLLRGREFAAPDFAGRSSALIVNETFARFYFGDSDPLGRSIKLNDSSTVQVVGVVGDIRDHALTGEVPRRMYLPAIRGAFGDPTALSFEVRTSGDPARLVPQLRTALLAVDPGITIEQASALAVLMQQSVSSERLLARLAGGFGVLSLLLASIGLYGVMSYAVTRRTGELGLRAALGASRAQVLRQVMGDALRLVGLGVVVGVPLAVAAAQLLKSQLHGLGVIDIPSLVVALGVLGGAALLAALTPALRASRVSPLVALQQE